MICHHMHSFYSLAGDDAARSDGDGAQLMNDDDGRLGVQRLDSRWQR
jgi:hypothetical protein